MNGIFLLLKNISLNLVCSESEFGCCPDNSTFASGPYFSGCSNCSISEFGCCSDNVIN